MRVIIAGSRTLDYDTTLAAIKACDFSDEISIIVSGCAKGVDTHGETYAQLNNIPVVKFPANWNAYGKSAGYKRNEQMAQNADALIAVWDGVSKGTQHMINLAQEYKLKVYVYTHNLTNN